MRVFLFRIMAIALLSLGWTVGSQAVTYNVSTSYNGYSLAGSVTTNGTMGYLAGSDIVDWDLTMSRPVGSSVNFLTSNSYFLFQGGVQDLIFATANSLVAQLSGHDQTKELSLRTNDYTSTGIVYAIAGYYGGGGLQLFRFGQTYTEQMVQWMVPAGDYQLATAAVPLPAGMLLLGSGLGALVVFGWRKKRLAAVPAVA